MDKQEAIKILKEFHDTSALFSVRTALETVFPELKEDEDELEWLKQFIREEAYSLSMDIRDNEDRIKLKKLQRSLEWLEKQKSVGEIVERCKKSWYNEGKIRGQIEGLTDDEKYQQGWHDALEKQGEQTINQPDFEIPFGAKDSELIEESYYIPEGYHAEISKDKVTIKKGERKPAWSEEDEMITLSIKQIVTCASFLNIVPETLDKIDKWLNSLKRRIGG